MNKPRQYLILVDKRDSEKFRRFRIGKFNSAIWDVLDKNNLKFLWGFHKGQISNSWKDIRKNDHVFFSVPNNNFEITAIVAKKLTAKKLGKAFWPDNPDSQDVTYFLLFDSIQKTNLLFTQTLDNTVKKVKMPFPGIYKLQKNFKTGLDATETGPDAKDRPRPKPFVMPDIKKAPTPKKQFEVMRFLRDSEKVKKLKNLYYNRCQICGYTFEYEKGKFYSEVHHYNPLKASADDELDNMIVVCPNHHAEFDHGMIVVDPSGTAILDRLGKKIADIHFKNGHRLNRKNIKSQLDRYYHEI